MYIFYLTCRQERYNLWTADLKLRCEMDRRMMDCAVCTEGWNQDEWTIKITISLSFENQNLRFLVERWLLEK